MPRKLNVGCGGDKKEGYVNLDWLELLKPDVVHDLNAFPYPFKDGSFDLIEAYHALEHLEKPFMVMKEMHRLLAKGGVLHVKVPHFSRGFTHAEHEHGFDVTFPLYFDKKFSAHGYYGVDFALRSMRLSWLAFFHLMPFMGYGPILIRILRGVNSVVSGLANLSPALASRIWCFWVGGFDEIEFKFIKI
ncbi:MAG: type 11 methyltransferase [Parcubacteria group bacterium Gr01-1014_8]|nr:MAG: type 11 methyltransferase [Parcubacteria group bacterium Gr01-1014_8]